jgi:hypothetical protein
MGAQAPYSTAFLIHGTVGVHVARMRKNSRVRFWQVHAGQAVAHEDESQSHYYSHAGSRVWQVLTARLLCILKPGRDALVLANSLYTQMQKALQARTGQVCWGSSINGFTEA